MKRAIIYFLCVQLSIISAAYSETDKTIKGNSKISGGLAGSGFSLRNAHFSRTGAKERLQLEIGNLRGEQLRGYPGYYHVEMQKNPNRLVIDLSQTPKTFIDPGLFADKLKSSKVVLKSSLLADPMDNSLTIVLDLAKAVKANVYQVKGKKGSSQIVIDIQ